LTFPFAGVIGIRSRSLNSWLHNVSVLADICFSLRGFINPAFVLFVNIGTCNDYDFVIVSFTKIND